MARNKYYKATEVLPPELVLQLQAHIKTGGYVWIPSIRKTTIVSRNHQIFYQRRVIGLSEKETAEKHAISIRRVRQIVKAIGDAGLADKVKAAIENAEPQNNLGRPKSTKKIKSYEIRSVKESHKQKQRREMEKKKADEIFEDAGQGKNDDNEDDNEGKNFKFD